MTTVEIRASVPAPIVSMLVQMLRDAGADVEWTPPLEQRGMAQDVHEAVVAIIATGVYDEIKAAVAQFVARTGGRAHIETREIDPPPRHARP
jgi:hypothetical protein